MKRTSALAIATAFCVWLPTSAYSTVYIGLQASGVNGGAITQVATDPVFASWSGPYGAPWQIQSVTVTSLGAILDSTSLNVLGTAPGDLNVYVTVTNAAEALSGFLSGLTSNILPAEWSVELSTWVDPLNGIFTTINQIGDAVFNSIGTDTDLSALTGVNPYSVTGLYQIHSGHGIRAASSTIHVEAVPEPSTLMLIGGGLVLLGMFFTGRKGSSLKA